MPQKPQDSPVYQLKVTLKNSKPPIWRRIQLRGDITLYKFHQIIQIVMGWENAHLHQFIADGIYYGEPDPDFGFKIVNERRARLNQILKNVKDKCIYEYDFGDSWEHDIIVEKIIDAEPQVRYPRCIKGKRNCPPEDIGGVWGYKDFLDALQDASHPEHEEYLDWAGDSFDPETFHIETLNQELKQSR